MEPTATVGGQIKAPAERTLPGFCPTSDIAEFIGKVRGLRLRRDYPYLTGKFVPGFVCFFVFIIAFTVVSPFPAQALVPFFYRGT